MKHISLQEVGYKFKQANKTNSLFADCIEVILQNEGGYVNHPDDPGGETNFGIAKKFYPNLDIKNLTKEKAIDIFYCDYWLKMNLNNIHDNNLVLQIFDCGVNCGIRTAIRMIQWLVNTDVDGIVGPKTEFAINNSYDDLVDLYRHERKKYYFSLVRTKPELSVFINGWIRRVDKTKFA